MQEIYTREEVVKILVSLLLYSGDKKDIKGRNFGEQANTIIDANNKIKGTDKSMISVIGYFKGD